MSPHQKAQALRAMIAQAEADEAAPHRPTLRERAMQILKRRPELAGMLCVLAPSQLECEDYYAAPTAYRLKRRARNSPPVVGISLDIDAVWQPLRMTQIPSLDTTNGPAEWPDPKPIVYMAPPPRHTMTIDALASRIETLEKRLAEVIPPSGFVPTTGFWRQGKTQGVSVFRLFGPGGHDPARPWRAIAGTGTIIGEYATLTEAANNADKWLLANGGI